jgi:hypothetical protein
MQEEIWKSIKGYEGIYEISNLSRLKRFYFFSIKKEIIYDAKSYKKSGRKPKFRLKTNKITKTYDAGLLVADTFIPNPYNCRDVRYKDNNSKNCKLENLEWDIYDHLTENEYPKEEWKLCPISPTIELSTLGRVRDLYTKKVFKGSKIGGYYYLTINYKHYAVHRLMILTFITNGKHFQEDVHHIDEIKINNRLTNLQLIDHREHGFLTILSESYKICYKGKVGRFNKDGILLESFLGEKAVVVSGYDYSAVVGVCRGRIKSYKKFYWRRFPKGFEPVIGKKYDLNSEMLNIEKCPLAYKKKTNRKEYKSNIL